MTSLTGPRVAIITGSAQGIGRAIALRLAEDGYDIVVNDLPTKIELMNSVVEEIKAKGRNAIFVGGDVSKEEDVDNLVNRAVEELGELRIMVANAAVGTPAANVVDTILETWNLNLQVNLTGTFLCYRAAARQLIKQGKGGRIIGASSGMGKRGSPGLCAYSSTKFGIRGLTQSLASEVGEYGITVNAYAPGAIETDLRTRHLMKLLCGSKRFLIIGSIVQVAESSMSELMGQSWKQALTRRTPLGRCGVPDDIAGLVSYLASDSASFMTGQSVSINGGTYFD